MTDLQPADWEVEVVDEAAQALIEKLHHEINAPGHRDALNARIAAYEAEIKKAEDTIAKIPVVGEAAAKVVEAAEEKAKEEIPVVERKVEETVVKKVEEEVGKAKAASKAKPKK